MKISIIVSMYRAEKHIRRFLRDVDKLSDELLKNNIAHEIILVSNDATDIERQLLNNLSGNCKVLYVERESIYASWNRGAREAGGEFVTFWGIDDTRFAQAIIDGIKTLEETATDITYFPFRYYRFMWFFGLKMLVKIKTFIPPKFDEKQFAKEMHLGPHFIVRRSLFDNIGYFDDSFKIAGDFEFQVRAAGKGARFARTLTYSGIFRNDGTTLSGSRASIHNEENARIIDSS